MWWADKVALSLPSSAGQKRKKQNKKFPGQDEGRERSLRDYCRGQNRLGEISLIYYQSDQTRVIRNETKNYNTFPPPLPFFLSLLLTFATSSTAQRDRE